MIATGIPNQYFSLRDTMTSLSISWATVDAMLIVKTSTGAVQLDNLIAHILDCGSSQDTWDMRSLKVGMKVGIVICLPEKL